MCIISRIYQPFLPSFWRFVMTHLIPDGSSSSGNPVKCVTATCSIASVSKFDKTTGPILSISTSSVAYASSSTEICFKKMKREECAADETVNGPTLKRARQHSETNCNDSRCCNQSYEYSHGKMSESFEYCHGKMPESFEYSRGKMSESFEYSRGKMPESFEYSRGKMPESFEYNHGNMPQLENTDPLKRAHSKSVDKSYTLKLSRLRQWEYTSFGQTYKRKKRQFRDCFTFKIMSYNILAQHLLERHIELYENCSPGMLTWNFRKWNLLKEMKSMDADIMCFQEVQADHYEQFFKPEMIKIGYSSQYFKRPGIKEDGCATFYKTQKFHLESTNPVDYFREGCQLLDRENIALVLVLRAIHKGRISKSKVCIANTHLLYNPKRGDIKLVQLAILLSELDKLAFKGFRENTPEYHPILLCGDLNAKPYSPLYHLVVKGTLNYDQLFSAAVSGQREFIKNSKLLDKNLITPYAGITEQCQYTEVAQSRNKLNSKDSVGRSDSSSAPGNLQNVGNDSSLCIVSNDCQAEAAPKVGTMSHALNFISVYPHVLKRLRYLPEVTTHHGETSCTVDYIFTRVRHKNLHYRSKNRFDVRDIQEQKLRLISRYGILSSSELDKAGSLPNYDISSDHLSLCACFLFFTD